MRIESECESIATDIVDGSGKVITSACGKAFELNVRCTALELGLPCSAHGACSRNAAAREVR